MKIFIDLGAFNGDTLEMALEHHPDFDKFYAFEPFSRNFEELKRTFAGRKNVMLYQAAADVRTGKSKLYLQEASHLYPHTGHTLLGQKADVSQEAFEVVDCIDFSQFVIDTFHLSDTIILKMDIEGMEYDLLSKMIQDGSIKYIARIYCEWHHTRAKIGKKRHKELIKQLRRLGFDLSGVNRRDEFSRVLNHLTEGKGGSGVRALTRLVLRLKSRAKDRS